MPITPELERDVQALVDQGLNHHAAVPYLRELAEKHQEKEFRVRAAFRLLRQRRVMDEGELKERHQELHEALDELVACYISTTSNTPRGTTLMDFMQWSGLQRHAPACAAKGHPQLASADS